MPDDDFAVIGLDGRDTLVEGTSLEDTWESVDEEMFDEYDCRVAVIEFDGYSEIRILEGSSLEEAWLKIGEKVGRS